MVGKGDGGMGKVLGGIEIMGFRSPEMLIDGRGEACISRHLKMSRDS